MVKRSIKFTLEFLGVVVAGFSVLFLLAALRLSYGPVSLDFITPYVEEGLSSDDGATVVSIGHSVLTWSRRSRTIDVQLTNVSVRDRDGAEQGFVPELSIAFSLRALLAGRIAPTRLELFAPRLTVIRRPDGGFAFGDSQVAEPSAPASDTASQRPAARLGGALTAEVIAHLAGPADFEGPLGYLRTISLLNADFVFDDRRAGILIFAPGSDIILNRDRNGIGGSARLNVVAGAGRTVVDLAGGYNAAGRALDLEARFRGLVPAEFAGLAPALAPLGGASFPIDGKVLARTTLAGELTDIAVDIEAGGGTLKAPEFFDTPVSIQKAAFKAQATDNLKRLVIEAFTADFKGPRIALSGKVTRADGRVAAEIEAAARDVATADLHRLWPKGVAPGAREWVLENIEKGGVRELRLKAGVTAREDAAGTVSDLALSRLDGGFDYSGLSIHFLRPMPPVTDISGRATITPSALNFVTSGGKLGELRVTEGKFRTYDLDIGTELLDLELVAAGPVATVVGLLEHPRLNLVKRMGISSKAIKGVAATRLVLKFPLRKDLKFDHMQIAAASNLRDVTVPGVALGNDLTEGNLLLRLDKRGMDVAGKVRLGGVPADLKWTENFYSGATFVSRYSIKGMADDAARARFGLDFLAPYVMGPVGTDLIITKFDKRRMSLNGALDLKAAKLAMDAVGWAKPAGVAGFSRLDLAIEDDKAKNLESLIIRAGDLRARGSIAFRPDGRSVAGFNFEQLVYGENDLSLRGRYGAGDALTLDLAGKKADIRYFLKQKEDDKPKQPLDITMDIKTVRASPFGVISDVRGRLMRDSADWQIMNIKGKVGEKATPLDMNIGRTTGVRQIKIISEDAGAALRAFGIAENVIGGSLNIEGRYDDAKAGRPLNGHLAIRKFHMVKAPFLAKLLAVASLTGILDTLSGKGITFDAADVPFVKTRQDLELKNVRAHGGAVGFTATGHIDLDKDTMNLTGTVVPAYSLNSVFGDLPLIGSILVPEKGSGLFAATYSMRGSIDNPDVGVNPLATLTPGFLRGLFNIFDAPEKNSATPAPGRKPNAKLQQKSPTEAAPTP